MSDAPWLPRLPEGWETVQMRRVATFRNGADYKDVEVETGGFPVYGSGGEFRRASGYLYDGASVLFGRKGTINRPLLVSGKFWTVDTMFYTELRPNVEPRFLHYYATTMPFEYYSTSTALPSMTQGELGGHRMPLPPFDEQRAISDYLDRETAQIDKLIAGQQRLIELLRERRDAIAGSYFGGSSGKRATTVRRVLRPLARPAVPGLGVITAYRDGTVTLRSNRRDDGYTFSDTEHGYQEIRSGDLVFHALDGFAGAIGVSDSHGNATPVYHVCKPVDGDDPEYLAMLLRYLGVSGFLATQAPNVRERSVDFRNWAMLARIPLALPGVEEQRAAVADIQAQTSRVDTLVTEAERLIELAQERRSALITAAVTGQFDVRKVA